VTVPVTVTAAAVAVTVSPTSASILTGGTQQFTATVTNSSNTTVTWSVQEGAAGGAVSSTGLYTAPSTAGTYHVIATSAASGKTATATVVVSTPSSGGDPLAILPADRRTSWSPGIPGGIPTYTTNVTTIDAATYGNGTTDATAAINAALATSGTAASPRVVYLPAGTYRIANFINTSASYVVLRGAGPGSTKLRGELSGAPVMRFGNYNWTGSTVLDITGSVPKGSTQITVSSASGLKVGDIIQIDQLDDPSYVFLFDAIYSKRGPNGGSGPTSPGRTGHSGYRSVAEQKEITAISGNVVTFSPPTRINFDAAWAPQAWKVIDGPNGTSGYGVRGVGVEDMYVTGGNNDQIQFMGAAYSWIRNVESDGDPTTGIGSVGRHFWLVHGFRDEIRHCYVHHANHIGQGGGAYGISLGVTTSDTLVEDNIAVFLNKAILTEVSGSGNVFGYNYADNVKTDSANWMEGAANGSHQAYSHGDLWEGNAAANIGCDTTHGSSGGLVYFRNNAWGRSSDPTYQAAQTQNLRAFSADAWAREMTVIGNVLQAYPSGSFQPVYEKPTNTTNINVPAIYDIGDSDRIGNGGGGGIFDISYTTPMANFGVAAGVLPNATYTTHAIDMLYRHGNWDNVTNSVAWDPANSIHTLPASLYLTAKPAFFGSNTWPWVDPTATTAAARVNVLPAKQRYDAGTPNG
jgi:hypothetical protein